MKITRDDPRYVSRTDPRAVLHAWGGRDRTMDMGGWTDDDAAAFSEAIEDESLTMAGEALDDLSIHPVERDETGHVMCCWGPGGNEPDDRGGDG